MMPKFLDSFAVGKLTFILRCGVVPSILSVLMATVGPIGARSWCKNRIIRMCFDVLLEVLRPFEGLAAELASMWFQRDMNTNV